VSEVSVTPDVKPEIGEKPQSLPPASIELKPVYFAFDNFQLNGEGKEQLGKVYQLLKDYPDLRVRLLGHADAKGTAEYNLTLSEKRAASALKYLVELGVESGRLSSKGLGERNYAAINTNPDGTDNPEGRRLNRRVEYEITGDANKMIIITLPPVPEELRFRE
jgi:OOP family OmpA-OmpF porin